MSDTPTGILVLDKPAGITSACAVGVVKRMLPRKTKIGHAGTLDPFATGVLLLLIGKATKQCETLMGQEKEYLATLKLGAYTATDDPEAPQEPVAGATDPGAPAIDAILPRFVGTVLQTPPAFSAMKVGGRRAYDLARQGDVVKLEPRPVRIDSIERMAYEWPCLQLRIRCGRGTYIRSIARDLGRALNTGAHLTELRRTRIGPHSVDHAVTLDTLRSEGVVPHLVPIATSGRSSASA